MKVGWTMVLNTEKPETAQKLVKRVNTFLGVAQFLDPRLEKYYKGGYRYSLYTEHADFDAVRRLLDKIANNWNGVSWQCIQGIANLGIRITGVSWVNFWLCTEMDESITF